MYTQVLEFSTKHIGLISAIFATLCLLGRLEYLQWVLSSKAITPTHVSLLINRHHARVFDLREESEFLKAHLPQAVHMGSDFKEALFKKIDFTQPIIFITSEVTPPFHILKQLRDTGYTELYHLKGGMAAWESSRLPMIQSLLNS